MRYFILDSHIYKYLENKSEIVVGVEKKIFKAGYRHYLSSKATISRRGKQFLLIKNNDISIFVYPSAIEGESLKPINNRCSKYRIFTTSYIQYLRKNCGVYYKGQIFVGDYHKSVLSDNKLNPISDYVLYEEHAPIIILPLNGEAVGYNALNTNLLNVIVSSDNLSLNKLIEEYQAKAYVVKMNMLDYCDEHYIKLCSKKEESCDT